MWAKIVTVNNESSMSAKDKENNINQRMPTTGFFRVSYNVCKGSVLNFVFLIFTLIPEAGCGQNPQNLVNTGYSSP